jgi:hypothetical protein
MTLLERASAGHEGPGSAEGSSVSLSHLLRITTLSPAQAVFVALRAVEAVKPLHDNGYTRGHGALRDVLVDQHGLVRIGTPPPDLAVLLRQLARGAPSSGDDRAAELLAALDAAADHAEQPGSDLDLVAAPLESVAGEPDVTEQARHEVTALVTAVTRPSPSPDASSVPGPFAATHPPTPLSRVLRPLGRTIAAVVVLAAAVGLEFAFLHDRLARDVQLVLGGDRAAHSTSPSPERAKALPLPAPPAAGAVTGVDVRALQPCAPAADCEVRLLIRLRPQPEPLAVQWVVQVYDRCTGGKVEQPGGAVSVQPGGEDVHAVTSVSLPRGRSLAVVAVTEEPARAASPPLLVRAEGAC